MDRGTGGPRGDLLPLSIQAATLTSLPPRCIPWPAPCSAPASAAPWASWPASNWAESPPSEDPSSVSERETLERRIELTPSKKSFN